MGAEVDKQVLLVKHKRQHNMYKRRSITRLTYASTSVQQAILLWQSLTVTHGSDGCLIVGTLQEVMMLGMLVLVACKAWRVKPTKPAVWLASLVVVSCMCSLWTPLNAVARRNSTSAESSGYTTITDMFIQSQSALSHDCVGCKGNHAPGAPGALSNTSTPPESRAEEDWVSGVRKHTCYLDVHHLASYITAMRFMHEVAITSK